MRAAILRRRPPLHFKTQCPLCGHILLEALLAVTEPK
jgi:hypothetical protein